MRASLITLLVLCSVCLGERQKRRSLHHLPYGDAGCGWGSIVMGKDDPILGATTNQVSGNQTFAMTSGTSNCIDYETDEVVEEFIELNRPRLQSEWARGKGEMLSTLEHLMGCPVGSLGKSQLDSGFSSSSDFRTQLVASIRQSGIACAYF